MALARRILTAAVAMAATFGLLWVGQAVAHQTMVASPIARALRVAGVRSYAMVANAPSVPAVRVRLRNGVDLEAVATTLDQRLEPIFGTAPVLETSGPGQARLRAALETVALPVEQGVATGRFVAMQQAVERLAAGRGLTARVEVDSQAVYVTLAPRHGRGDAYAIFPRAPAAQAGTGGMAS